MHSKDLSIENAGQEQIKLSKDVNDISKGEKPIQKFPFMKNLRFLPDVREEFFNNFKSNVFLLEKSISQWISESTPDTLGLSTPKQLRKQGRIYRHKTSSFKGNEILLMKLEMMKKI